MCSDPVIKTQGLGKCYQIYGQPRDRLLQLPLHRGKPRYRELWALKEVSLEIRKGEALRLPVVSTDFGEMSVRRHTPGVFLSDTAADIPQVMRQALAFSEPLANTLQFGEANSWTKRFEVALADPTNQPTNVEAISGACSRSRPLFVEWHKHRGMIRFYGKFFRDDYPKVLSWCICAGVWLRFGAIVGYYSAVRLRQIIGVTR